MGDGVSYQQGYPEALGGVVVVLNLDQEMLDSVMSGLVYD